MGIYTLTLNATSASNIAGGGIAWTTPKNGAVEDGTYTTATLLAFEKTDYLNGITGAASFSGFRPIITGVAAQFLGSATTGDIGQVTEIQLTHNGVGVGTAQVIDKPIGTVEAWDEKGSIFGSDGELWGETSTSMYSLLTGSKFLGFRFWIEEIGGVGDSFQVDAMRIVIYYDKPKRHSLLGCGL